MSQLIVANVAAPFVLSQTGNILLFVSIIPVEMIVIFLCLKFSEITISFSRLFIAVLVANIATSIVGIPLLFNATVLFSISGIGMMILLISFLLSFCIESIIYGIVLKVKNIPRCKIVQFSCLSNLASYIIFYLALISTIGYNNSENLFLTRSPHSISSAVRSDIHNYISFQRTFYYDKNRFANNWEELKFPNSKKSRSGFYQYDFQGDATKANFTATSKRKDFTSYLATIFIVKDKDNYQFIQGICETDKPSMIAPEIPQLVNGKFQCPPGSLDKSDEFGLRDRSKIDGVKK
jgi:Type IV pilin-like G and H, putative